MEIAHLTTKIDHFQLNFSKYLSTRLKSHIC